MKITDRRTNAVKTFGKLETGDVPLDDAITEFNKAMKLAKSCDEKLKKAEESITKLVKDNGEIVDFQVEE